MPKKQNIMNFLYCTYAKRESQQWNMYKRWEAPLVQVFVLWKWDGLKTWGKITALQLLATYLPEVLHNPQQAYHCTITHTVLYGMSCWYILDELLVYIGWSTVTLMVGKFEFGQLLCIGISESSYISPVMSTAESTIGSLHFFDLTW